MIALVPVREGVLPAGADETIAECGGRVVLAGSDVAAVPLDGLATDVRRVELGPFAVARWTTALVTLLTDVPDADEVVLPESPDGRDLAPRLAAALGRQLLAGATTVTPAVVVRRPRRWSRTPQDPPRRAVRRHAATRRARHRALPGRAGGRRLPSRRPGHRRADASTPDAVVVDVLPPDVRTMDLAEARHIVGGGAGLDSAERFTATRHDFARTHRRCDGRHPRDHRPRLGQPRPSDRYHRCRRRPDPVRVVRRERCRAAHERAGCPGAHHQRQHRAALPDDGDVGSRRS